MTTQESEYQPHAGQSRAGQSERRRHPHLREIFDAVVERVEPFYRAGAGLNGSPAEYWATRVVHEDYPDLSAQDVRTLVTAAGRYCRERAQ